MQPYYEQSGITIYHGDCREVIGVESKAAAEYPNKADGEASEPSGARRPSTHWIDVVITDPPYDARTHEGARSHGDTESKINFPPLDVALALPPILAAARRWVVAFCTMEMIAAYQSASGAAWVRAGFWRRPDGAPQFTGDRPGTPGDALAIMHRVGKKRWNGGGQHAYWECGVERSDRVHPAQKPLALMRHLVADFSDVGEVILDPYMGSGTTIVAAKALNRRAIGIELEEKYCEIAAKRLQQEALPLEVA